MLSKIAVHMYPLTLLYLLLLLSYSLLGHYYFGEESAAYRTLSNALATTATMSLGSIDNDLVWDTFPRVILFLLSFHVLNFLILGNLFAIVLKRGQAGVSLEDDATGSKYI